MFLLTYIINGLLALLCSLGSAIGSITHTNTHRRISKERMDYYRAHEEEWINKPLCPVFREGNKLMCIADRQYDLPFYSIKRGTKFEVIFGFDPDKNEYGLLHKPTGRLIFDVHTFINWINLTHLSVWIPMPDGNRFNCSYRCNNCGAINNWGHGSMCVECGKHMVNIRY